MRGHLRGSHGKVLGTILVSEFGPDGTCKDLWASGKDYGNMDYKESKGKWVDSHPLRNLVGKGRPPWKEALCTYHKDLWP